MTTQEKRRPLAPGGSLMALAVAVSCMFSVGQANAFTTNDLLWFVDKESGERTGKSNGGTMDKAPRWDSVNPVFGVGKNRSLVGGLEYNFEDGTLTKFFDKFSFVAGVTQGAFSNAVTASFNAWSFRDSFVSFTKTDTATVLDFKPESNDSLGGNQIEGNEIDFFARDLPTFRGLTSIWGVDEKIRLTNDFYQPPDGLFPSTQIYSADVVIDINDNGAGWTLADWQATFTHELGHALGLGDAEDAHFFDDDVFDPFLPNNGLVVNDAMTINQAGDVRYLLSDWGQPCKKGAADAQCAGILMRSEPTGLLALAPDDVAGLHFLYPVPEPETYAMLLAGLGLLSFVARRRKQNEAAAA